MIEIYVNSNQLYNFLVLKEPVALTPNPISESYIRFVLPLKDVHIEIYRTYSTIEFMTFRKKVKLWMKKSKKK